ncbi:hypothetical protein BOTBODRAFT_188033 [Botryobasidium botryosum FD-172 SS1]|uniref:F-box domain-containing protein n=1 Tax=Botryobasidium botryosum (strain FD-172 SS1) TaxID=930990 RepID=A0A067MRA1_BOTB1|nr:hypothetical protein BOTBODRAFT_188033 [Botryobasidium botryosum FD-172 SS1]
MGQSIGAVFSPFQPVNPQATVQQLSFEALCELMILSVEVHGTDPVMLSHVCVAWRDAAHNIPRLWRKVDVDLSYKRVKEKTAHWLDIWRRPLASPHPPPVCFPLLLSIRSSEPLHNLTTENETKLLPIIQLLCGVSPYWGMLTLSSSPWEASVFFRECGLCSTPRLSAVTIELLKARTRVQFPIQFFAHTDVSMFLGLSGHLIEPRGLIAQRLTTLDILLDPNHWPDQLYLMLSSCTNLVNLRLRAIQNQSCRALIDVLPPGYFFNFPFLRFLSVSGIGTLRGLGSFQAPSLAVFHADDIWWSNASVHGLAEFLCASSSLEIVRLQGNKTAGDVAFPFHVELLEIQQFHAEGCTSPVIFSHLSLPHVAEVILERMSIQATTQLIASCPLLTSANISQPTYPKSNAQTHDLRHESITALTLCERSLRLLKASTFPALRTLSIRSSRHDSPNSPNSYAHKYVKEATKDPLSSLTALRVEGMIFSGENFEKFCLERLHSIEEVELIECQLLEGAMETLSRLCAFPYIRRILLHGCAGLSARDIFRLRHMQHAALEVEVVLTEDYTSGDIEMDGSGSETSGTDAKMEGIETNIRRGGPVSWRQTHSD